MRGMIVVVAAAGSAGAALAARLSENGSDARPHLPETPRRGEHHPAGWSWVARMARITVRVRFCCSGGRRLVSLWQGLTLKTGTIASRRPSACGSAESHSEPKPPAESDVVQHGAEGRLPGKAPDPVVLIGAQATARHLWPRCFNRLTDPRCTSASRLMSDSGWLLAERQQLGCSSEG